jgi:hypothetical protein
MMKSEAGGAKTKNDTHRNPTLSVGIGFFGVWVVWCGGVGGETVSTPTHTERSVSRCRCRHTQFAAVARYLLSYHFHGFPPRLAFSYRYY